MKALFKFFLLLALIVGGKLTKEAAPVTVATKTTPSVARQDTPVVLVHQVLTSEPVAPASYGSYPASSREIVGMF
jgi:hypothetical protein